MMADVIGAPSQGRVLQRPPPCDEKAGFDPDGTFEAAVGHEPVVADRDAEAGHNIQSRKHAPVEGVEAVQIPKERHADKRGRGDGEEQCRCEVVQSG